MTCYAQGYTQAAWWNRRSWAGLGFNGSDCDFLNFLLGYRERRTAFLVLLVVPVIVSIWFFLIADIDSPHGGVIRVTPRNLLPTSELLQRAPEVTLQRM
jgi:hypothetical protein